MKVTRRSSLAEELLKIVFFLFVFHAFLTTSMLYLFTDMGLLPSALIGVGFSLIFVAVVTVVFKLKFEEVLGKLYYLATVLAEHKERPEEVVVPFTLQQELEEVVKVTENALVQLRKSCERKVKDLELEIVPMVEKSGELIKEVEKLKSGYLSLDEIPVGLDPVGALGLALKESVEEIKEKIEKLKELSAELEGEVRELELETDEETKKKLKKLESIILELKRELEFFK
ncbi:MAG: hypothetical protein GXO03_03895 [Aquificae bacterium]|nr:hypothetical protein [Aquificota bacterium]